MKELEIELKWQMCNISDAMLRNINENFLNISFEIRGGDLQVKVILKEKGQREESYIDDFITELSALQLRNCVASPIIEISFDAKPLKNIVYSVCGSASPS